ncbi:MAG TPA: hypothetical protein VG245_07050 [Candidatus Dormibacteraeota bacterium]|jgi:hypothetical protein|nr:hypothetical protein [Candidatus Dormibacteraeota bacterium]
MARERLSRAEQRFNYGIAILAVAVVVVLIVASPQVTFAGTPVPVLALAVLAGAFLFGLGQMVVGLTRRRRYLRDLAAAPPEPPRE